MLYSKIYKRLQYSQHIFAIFQTPNINNNQQKAELRETISAPCFECSPNKKIRNSVLRQYAYSTITPFFCLFLLLKFRRAKILISESEFLGQGRYSQPESVPTKITKVLFMSPIGISSVLKSVQTNTFSLYSPTRLSIHQLFSTAPPRIQSHQLYSYPLMKYTSIM